jgi:tetratricopeptide (TPR) repeat protein
MPFVRKTDSQGSQPPTDTRKLFIGRTGELLFFVQNILKPEEPTHNIISIWGQGGVGKSTLLSRFIDEAHSANIKDYCLTATIDELQTTPASMMEKFATQLHMQGTFEKALKHYKKVLRTQQTEREMMQDTLVQRMPTFAGAAVEGVPFVGPLLGEGVKATAKHVLDRNNDVQKRNDEELFENPVNVLTRAFVDELNRITNTQVLLSSQPTKRHQRVILFFDTFEQLAAVGAPWLLDYFLQAKISNNVVLVVAGRDPIERSTSDGPKRWLPYLDEQIMYSISLDSFNEDETRSYLAKRGINDSDRIATIWQLSGGLPLYLGLLTSNPQGKIDPSKDVVDNFLRWIPEREYIKRQVALDASLFSRPFNQDDLTAFAYLPENELPSFYHWLVSQPFVRPQDGRYSYHDLAKELFSRHLYQLSRKGYNATRRALVQYYQQLIEEIPLDEGREVYGSTEWLELKLALAYQLFLLPDEVSPTKAIEHVLSAYTRTKTEQRGEIAIVLWELSQERINSLVNSNSRQIARQLMYLIEADPRSKERLVAASNLLEKVSNKPTFSQKLLARIHSMRGITYGYLNEYQRAIEDFDRALQLDPKQVWAYVERGYVFRRLQEFHLAIEDFNRALQLDPKDTWAYASRSLAFFELNEYQRAIEDCDRAIQLDPKYTWAYVCRSIAYRGLYKYRQAIEDCNHALELNSNFARAYFHRSIAYSRIHEYQAAIEDCNQAQKLDPRDSWAYIQRGIIYRELKDYRQAFKDFEIAIELDPNEAWAYAQRGITNSILKQYEPALADFNRTIELNPKYSRIYGRRGFSFLILNDIKQAWYNYARSWEQDSTLIHFGWMAEWTAMCQESPNHSVAERLEMIAATSPESYAAYVCRGVAMWLRKHYEDALAQLEQAIKVGPGEWSWDSHFWKGMTYASLGQAEEAIAAVERSLELELPPILLTPLRWFEQDRPVFYQKYVVPLMARYDLL